MRMQVFDDSEDYEYFIELLKTGLKKEGIELHSFCLMPNHFHLLVVPTREGSLSRFMQWVMTSHVRNYHKKNKTSGHVWQGRYKSFIVQEDSYYITVMRYIEANALRAKLVKRAEDWLYGSLHVRKEKDTTLLCKNTIELPEDWIEYVNERMKPSELKRVRNSVNRQAPLGEESWQVETANRFGLMSTLKDKGRPKRVDDN